LKTSNPDLGPTQPPKVPGTLSPEAKRSGREVDHSPTSRADGKHEWSYTPQIPYLYAFNIAL